MPNTDFQNGIIVASIAGGGSNIIPSGEIEITENGEYNVTAYETAIVNVVGGGAYSGVAVIPIQSIVEALPTTTTVTV